MERKSPQGADEPPQQIDTNNQQKGNLETIKNTFVKSMEIKDGNVRKRERIEGENSELSTKIEISEVGKEPKIQQNEKDETNGLLQDLEVDQRKTESVNEVQVSGNSSPDSGSIADDDAEKAVRMIGRRKRRKPSSPKHIIDGEYIKSEVTGYQGDNVVMQKQEGAESTERSNVNGSMIIALNQSRPCGQNEGSGEQNDVQNQGSSEQQDQQPNGSGGELPNVPRRPILQGPISRNPRYGNRTFSSFTPAEQEELKREASHIHGRATFKSYEEFEKFFEAYKIVGSHPYRVASSEKLRDGRNVIDECFKYKYIVFHCAHYGKPRKRGDGKRPNQSYLPSGCDARFRLNVDTAHGCLRITSFYNNHSNHANNEEDYQRVISKKRRNELDGPKVKKGRRNVHNEESGSVESHNGVEEIPNTTGEPNVFEKVTENSIGTSASSSHHLFDSPATTSFEQQENKSVEELQSLDPLLQQVLLAQVIMRQQRIEFVVLNAYVMGSSQYLPQSLHVQFMYSVYGGEYHLSDWSDMQLRDVMTVVLQPPEILLRDKLPPGISMDEVKDVQPPLIQRAVTAIRDEKLKRIDEMFSEIARYVLDALLRPDFPVVFQQFEKFAAKFIHFNDDEVEMQRENC